jgi:hypothetical protein
VANRQFQSVSAPSRAPEQFAEHQQAAMDEVKAAGAQPGVHRDPAEVVLPPRSTAVHHTFTTTAWSDESMANQPGGRGTPSGVPREPTGGQTVTQGWSRD